MQNSTSVERLGRNQLVFREVNERIREVAGKFGVLSAAMFVCECSQGDCMEAIDLELEEYDALRTHPGTFLVTPGHEAVQHEKVVVNGRRYNVVAVGQDHPARLHERNV